MYCGNAAPHIVFSRTTGDILILVANITTFGEEKRNWKWMRYNMKSEHNKLLTSTFRPFGNVQCDFDFVLMAHEEKKHPNKKSLEGKSMCFLRFCCHSSDNFEVRNHISGVIFGLWLCIWALLFFLPMLFAPRTVIHLQSSIHSLPLYFMTERSEETPTSNQTIFIHINTAFGIDKPKTTAIISI